MAPTDIYDLVYDVASAGLPDVPIAIFGVALGSLVSFILRLTGKKGWWLGLCFAALWGGLFVASSFVPHLLLQSGAARECVRVEGLVTDFVPQPYEGHAPGDRFRVAGRHFEYSNFSITPGYRRTVAYGGVHIAGRRVRLCVVDSDIVRLEVQRQDWPRALSTVSFQLTAGGEVEFSKYLYGVTQQQMVRSHPVVWAKDFALSDFELTIAGGCEGAIADLEPVIVQASKDLANRVDILAAYGSSARCRPSPTPPERSWKAPPPILAYKSRESVTMVAGGQSSPVTPIHVPGSAQQ